MPAAIDPFAVLNHRSVGPSGGGSSQRPQDQPSQLVESTALLKGGKAVGILHNGALYRLQATKLGKLILTK